VFSRADRREWAVLGLLALAWALLAAPLLHRAAHAHGHAHHHGDEVPPAQHGHGSLEHQQALFLPAPKLASPVFVAVRRPLASLAVPARPELTHRRAVAQAQAP
jgi:hypothetical protein